MNLLAFLFGPDGRQGPRPITASEAGRKGAKVKRDRERERIIAKANEMRARQGQPPIIRKH